MTEKKVKKNLHQKLHSVMMGCKKLVKEEGGGLPYKSVSHNMVSTQVRQQFEQHGLLFLPYVKSHSRDGNIYSVTVACEIIDIDTGEKLSLGDFPGSGVDNQDKGYGKAISYAFKYLLQKFFLMEIGEDEEVDHSKGVAKTEEQQQKEKITSYVTAVTQTLNNIRKKTGTNPQEKLGMLDGLIKKESENFIKLAEIDDKQHAILQQQIDKLSAELSKANGEG